MSKLARRAMRHWCFVAAFVCCAVSVLQAQTSPLDTNFKPPFFVVPSPAAHATLLGSGKYVVYLNTNALVEAQSEFLPQNEVTPITRYNSDGSRDTSFEFQLNSQVEQDYDNITAVAPLTGDELYIAAFQNPYGSNVAATSTLLHLKSNGSIDTTFGFGAQFGPHEIRGITVDSASNILVGGFFSNLNGVQRSGIARILANGSPDTAFNSTAPQVSGGTYGVGVWANPVVQPTDSKILIGGDFTTVASNSYPGIARLNPDGTLDASFVPSGFSNNGAVRGIVVLPNEQIVLAGRFSVSGGIANAALIRLNKDGSIDTSFAQVGGLGKMKALARLPDGSYLASNQSLYHFLTNGTRDSNFHEPALLLNQSSATGGQGAFSINVQSDGKILIGGSFTDIDDEGLPFNGSRFGVARLNGNGTLDTAFTTSHQTGLANPPNDFVLEPDGNTYISFGLTSPTGYPFATLPHNFGRLTPTGAIDGSYEPLAQQSTVLAASGFIQFADGSFIVQGTRADFTDDTDAVRVLQDGTLGNLQDGGNNGSHFDPTVATGVRLVDGSALLVARDAESIIAGNVVRRFLPSGGQDTSFAPDPQIASQMVQRDGSGALISVAMTMKLLASYPDGRVLFSYLTTDGSYHLVRLLPTGKIDLTLAQMPAPDLQATPNQAVTDPSNGNTSNINVLTSALGYADAEVDVTNRATIVGAFASYGISSAHGIVRLNDDGSVDSTFNPGTGVEWNTMTATATFFPLADNIETQGDGKFLVTGTFEKFNGTATPGIVRLKADGSVDTSFVAPATRIKSDPTPTNLKRQFDGSFLLSGPYASNNSAVSPGFIHFFGPPVITSPLSATVTLSKVFFYQFLTYGASSVSVNGLPAPLGLNSALSTITGTLPSSYSGPTTIPVTLSASNAFGTTTATLVLTVLPAPATGPVITSSTSATGRTGAPFHFQVITTGGSPATQLSATNLPGGLTFDPASGVISGTPQSAGSTAVTLNVTDPNGNATGILQLTFSGDAGLPVIVSPSSANVTSGQQFSYTIDAPVIGNGEPTSYNLIGILPVGLFFDNKTGVISGTYNGSPEQDGETIQRQLSGGVITNVQLFATNSHGTTTTPLVFFNAPIGSVNISTRLDVGTADNVLIGGFIVTGNAPKKVLIRAIGPSIKAGDSPLAGALQDTTLALYQGQTLLGSNDDWRSDQEQEIKDTGVPPTDDRESAMVATLAAQTGYTAIVGGKDGTAGIGLAEIYDLGTASLDSSSVSHLANISTRGTVLTADNVMIGGFIISGANTKILARAIGPSLAAQGVASALQDPMLELHDSSGATVFSNDDWRSTQQDQIIATTIPPSDDRESAIVATLQPGAYTAVVRGKDDSTGVALVEIYSLQ